MLSARAGEESRVEGLAAGADDYLIKPFSARELLARVDAHLNLQRLRRLAGRASRERTAQFETLLNEAPLGVYLVDSQFQIRQMNPMARQLLDSASELIGDDFREVIQRLWPKSYAHELVELMQHTLQTGATASIPEPSEVRTRRGQAQYYEWQLNRIPLPDGQPGVVCYIHDMSTQVLAQLAIARSEANFRLLVTASSDILFKMSADWSQMDNLQGKNFLANTEHPTQHWLDLYIPADDQPRVQAAVNEAIRTKSPFELEHRVIQANGRIGWTFSRAIPLLNDQGDIIEWFGAASNITSRKQAEQSLTESEARLRKLSAELEKQVLQRTRQLQASIQDLQRSNENLEQFAYVASHDLQEPLRKIQSFSAILISQHQDQLGSGVVYLNRMQSAASRMSVLIKDLLTYSRIATGQDTTAAVPLNGVIDRVLQRSGPGN